MRDALVIFAAKYLVFLLLLLAAVFFATRPRALWKKIAWLSCVSLPLAFILSRVAGHFYYHARPFVEFHFTPLIVHAADNGFPSDHVLLAFALAFIVWAVNKRWGLAFAILAALVAIGRVSAGVHAWVDVIGSVILSGISVMIAFAFLSAISNKTKNNPPQP